MLNLRIQCINMFNLYILYVCIKEHYLIESNSLIR